MQYSLGAKGLDASSDNTSDFTVKAGVIMSMRFEIYASYFFVSQITNSLDYNTSLPGYQVGFNYCIGKISL